MAIAVNDFLKLIAWFIEQGEGFWSTFDGTGFSATGPVGHLVASDDLQQLGNQLSLLLF